MEYYDFLIYGTAAAPVFNEVVFTSISTAEMALGALAALGVGYLACLLGPIVIGYLGDQCERRVIVSATLLPTASPRSVLA